MENNGIQTVLEQYPGTSREHLIPILQEFQDKNGYISREAVVAIGAHLKLPTSKIYGVATFYNQFRFQPIGTYHILVCRGTACHVKGSADVLMALEQELNIKPGETTRDGMFSLEVVACIGACGLAPVISVNGEFHAGVETGQVADIIAQYRNQETSRDE